MVTPNMWAPIGIVAGLAGLVVTGAFAYVTYLNRQAQKKINQAATIIERSQSITTIAQEKIDELLEKQIELNELSTSLATNQKADITLKNINIKLDFIKKGLLTLHSEIHGTFLNEPTELQEKYDMFKNSYNRLGNTHTKLSLKCNTKIIKGGVINIQDIENIKTLEHECTELRLEINDYLENLPEND
ncbi:hypothetical protein ACQKIY_22160 [Bacillus mycoides]|uniref:hypothetical protein n=1 Tax=Bacillus mycoides TaxID=1405 RepID=UPI0035CA1F80